MSFKVPEQYRVLAGKYATEKNEGNYGAFSIPHPIKNKYFTVIASDGMGWEHVSVSFPSYTPTWDEMCYIKDLFWDDTDCVVQYHPPRSEYVNQHKHCLHLWKSTDKDIPMPKNILV